MYLFSLLIALSVIVLNSGEFSESTDLRLTNPLSAQQTLSRREDSYDSTTTLKTDLWWSSLSTVFISASRISLYTFTGIAPGDIGRVQQLQQRNFLRSSSIFDKDLDIAEIVDNNLSEEAKAYDDDTLPLAMSTYFQQVLPSFLHLESRNDTSGDSADDDRIRGVIITDQETPFLIRVRNILSQGGVIAGVVCGFLFLCLIGRLCYLRYRLRCRQAEKRYRQRRSKISPWTIITAEMTDHSNHRAPVMSVVPDNTVAEATSTPTVFATTIVSTITEDNLRNSGLSLKSTPHIGVWRETPSPPAKNLLAAVVSMNSYFMSQDELVRSSERCSDSNNSNVDGSYLDEEETEDGCAPDVESGSDEKENEEEISEVDDAVATPHSAGSITSDDVLLASACRVKQQATPRSSNSSTHTSNFFPFSRFASRRRSSSRQQSTSEFEVDIFVC